ncbi:MAG: hypothetical protein WCA21_10210, partial [Terracidiphilus sp.]
MTGFYSDDLLASRTSRKITFTEGRRERQAYRHSIPEDSLLKVKHFWRVGIGFSRHGVYPSDDFGANNVFSCPPLWF